MSEITYIKKCLQLIETEISWGNRETWVYDDFRRLQEMILDASGTSLSVHTLERLFGKLKTHKNYNPQAETKKALAVFLGYDNWVHFKAENPVSAEVADQGNLKNATPETGEHGTLKMQLSGPDQAGTVVGMGIQPEVSSPAKAFFSKKVILSLALIFMVICSYFALDLSRGEKPPVNLNFKAVNPYGKRPHTVKFTFDISGLKAKDISIDFDGGKPIHQISGDQKHLFKTYLAPGIHTVQLKADGKTVASTEVFIDLEGWKGYAYTQYEDTETRVDIPDESLRMNGRLYTPPHVIDSLIDPTTHYFVEFLNVHNFGVDGDNMAFETRFRNNDNFDYQICFDMWFKLIGTKGVLKMHFLKSGCAGFVQMIFGDKVLNGHKQDLSVFTREFYDWKRARMEVENKKVNIYFEDKLIYTISYHEPIGKIMGISITSKGGGETDYVRLYNDQQELVYSECF